MSDRKHSGLTPRRAVAAFAIVLVFAFAASWTSLPARAGGAAATPSVAAPRQGQHRLAIRTGTVYLSQLPAATLSVGRRSRPLRVANPAAYRQGKAALDAGATLPGIPALATLALTTTPTVSTNFAGLAYPDSQCGTDCEPPDTQVAAGPSNVVEVINIVGQVYTKTGTPVGTAFNLNTLFGVDPAIFSSDPRIAYDTISGRWFISFLTFDNDNYDEAQNGFFDLAVSMSSDPTAGFYMYSIETPGDGPDQPSLGFNDDKVAQGSNSYSCDPDCAEGPYEGNEFLVWNKSELLAGDATIDTDYYPPGQDTTDFPIIAARSRSSTSTLWMLSAFGTELDPPNPPIVIDELNIWSVTGVPGTDTGSAATDTIATITDFIDPPSAQQKNGSGNKIDTADSRLLDAVYRDGLLWGSGNDSCLPTGDTLDRSCLQYFEVLTGGASPVVNQDFSFGTKNAYDYYPSVDLDSSDDLISSFSQSSSTEFPSAYVDGRLARRSSQHARNTGALSSRSRRRTTEAVGAIIRVPASIQAIRLRFGSRRNTQPTRRQVSIGEHR